MQHTRGLTTLLTLYIRYREMQVSERIKSFDRQYQVSSNVNNWIKKFQSAAKTMEENLKEQVGGPRGVS